MDNVRYVVTHKDKRADSDDFTNRVKGKVANGNRGYADVLIFKQESIRFCLCLVDLVRKHRASPDFVTVQLKAGKDQTWRAGINKTTLTYTSFVEDYLCGTNYDACVKSTEKNNRQAKGIGPHLGITELLADVRNRYY